MMFLEKKVPVSCGFVINVVDKNVFLSLPIPHRNLKSLNRMEKHVFICDSALCYGLRTVKQQLLLSLKKPSTITI